MVLAWSGVPHSLASAREVCERRGSPTHGWSLRTGGGVVESPQVRQVLVVASNTATSARLMSEIEGRAAAGPCRFTLLIPDATDREAAERTLKVAVPLIRQAARAPV